MDCRTALEILEVARPDSDDVKQTELAWAQAHLDSCPRCEEAFCNRQALDRRIGRLMRDVSVPWDLKHKLLQAATNGNGKLELSVRAAGVADYAAGITGIETGITGIETDVTGSAAGLDVPAGSDAPVTPAASKSTVARPRRYWLKGAAVAAACLVGWVVVWPWLQPSQIRLQLDELRNETALKNPATLPPFRGEFEAAIPDGWSEGVSFAIPAVGFQLDGSGKHLAALYSFTFSSPKRPLVNGLLLVIPKKSIEDPPSAVFFGAGSRVYVQSSTGTYYATAAWTEGDLVYVCFVPSEDNALKALELALYAAPA